MKFSAALTTLSLFLATGVQAYHQLPSRYAEQRRGNQFVTGPCSADSDCQQGCCGFSTGKCAGPAVAQTNGSGGCGHGNSAPNCDVATLLGFQSQCIAGAAQGDLTDPDVIAAAKFAANLDGIKFNPSSASSGSTKSSSGDSATDSSCSEDSPSSTDGASSNDNSASSSSSSSGASSVAALAALQKNKAVVTSKCTADSDCQQGCCGFSTSKCAGPAIAQTNGSGGCGHGNAAPNCDVATLLGFQSQCIAGHKNGNLNAQATQAAASFAAQLDGLSFKPSVSSTSSSSGSSGSSASSSGAHSSSSSGTKSSAGNNSSSSSGTNSVAALAAGQQSKATVFSACTADSDCQQGCCGFSTGKCAGPAIAQTNGSGGCGHGNAAPNCDVATLLGFQSQCVAGHKNGNLNAPATQAAAAFAAQLDGLKFTPS